MKVELCSNCFGRKMLDGYDAENRYFVAPCSVCQSASGSNPNSEKALKAAVAVFKKSPRKKK